MLLRIKRQYANLRKKYHDNDSTDRESQQRKIFLKTLQQKKLGILKQMADLRGAAGKI